MAETPTVYVICDANCKFEGMTKEQIYAAILQAVNEGTISNIDSGFVQTIKTINGKSLKFFVGTQAEYEELTDDDKENLFAIITNDTIREGIIQAITDLQTELDELKNGSFVVTNADSANKIKSIIIRNYEELMSYIPLYPNAGYNSYAVANNEYAIKLPDGTVIPEWSSGILVVDADATLTLTCSDGSIISAYCNNATNTWTVQKLKQKPDEASHADSATYADNATYASRAIVAGSAESATSATKDGNGAVIASCYGKFSNGWHSNILFPYHVPISDEGVYLFDVAIDDFKSSCIAYYNGETDTFLLLDCKPELLTNDANYEFYRIAITDGYAEIQRCGLIGEFYITWQTVENNASIRYKKIWG